MATIPEAFNLAFQHHQAGRVQEAEALYRQILQAQPDHADALHLLGMLFFQAGQPDAAIDFINQAIKRNPEKATFYNNIGEAYRALGKLDDAAASFRQALALRPSYAEPCMNLGIVLFAQSRLDEAAVHFRQAIAFKPAWAEAYNNLGSVLAKRGALDEAIAHYRQAIAHNVEFAEAYNNLGLVFVEQGALEEAISHFRQAIARKVDYAEAYNHLGAALAEKGVLEEAIAQYQRAITLNPAYHEAYSNLGNALNGQGKPEEAIAQYRRAITLKPDYVEAYDNLGNVLWYQGKLEEAVASYRQAFAIQPLNGLKIKLATILPAIPESASEVALIRRQYKENINALLKDKLTLKDPVKEVGRTNFFLAYHGQNDRELQVKMAQLYERACPSLLYTAQHCSAGRRTQPLDKIRIGFISRFFNNHTVGKLNRGILAHLSREKFLVYAFFVPPVVNDDIFAFFRQQADKAIVLPGNLKAASECIAEEKLDVLYYQDIGMEPFTYFLAFSRLAPVQCVTWGHPVTTGIKTIDYFISSEDLEPEGAEGHYSERLVRLKYPPMYYYRPAVTRPFKLRCDFGLDVKKTVYLCPQSIFKLHPDFDDALGAILRADPKGEVVLIESRKTHWNETLLRRLRKTVSDVVKRIRFVPPQCGQHDYFSLLSVADVMLDPFHWSGGSTTCEALSVGTPIVTMPGEFMRGRVTYACYKQMGVLDCVATSRKDYVKLAVRLGTDRAYRAEVQAKILATHGVLYENAEAVREMEKFFLEGLEASQVRAKKKAVSVGVSKKRRASTG